MNEFWNLQTLYTGFDDPCYDADMTALKEKVAEMAQLSAGLETLAPIEGLRKGIALQEQVQSLVMKLAEYAQLRQSANTRDGEAGSMMGRIMSIYSGFAAPGAAFESWAAKIPNLPELVAQDDFLKDYTYLFSNLLESSRHLLEGRGEEIMAKMRMSGGDAWSEMQSY